MKKTIFLLLLTLSLLLTFAACGETQPATDAPESKTDIIASVPSDDNAEGPSVTNDAEISSVTKSDSDSVSTDSQTDTASDHTDTKTDSATETDTSGATVSTESRPTENTDTSSDKTTNTSKPTDTNTTNTTSTSAPSVSTSTATGDGSDETEDEDTPVEMTPLIAVTPENYYGKVWLKSQPDGATLVKAYEDIAKAAGEMKKEVSFNYSLTPEQLNTAWHCYVNDYPEHFWRNNGYGYSYRGNDVVSVEFEYNMSATEKATAQQKFDKAVGQLLDGLSGSMNQFDLEKALHDKVVMSTTYKQTAHAHDAYGVLVEREAVCEGYARALQLLLRKAGIQTLIVEGAAVDPVSQQTIAHAWNIVQINGKYYHLDVTWDDAGEPDHLEGIHYAWFNVPTRMLSEDHAIANSGYDLPDCTSDEENYFLKTGKYLETLTVEGLRKQLKEKDGKIYAHIYIKQPVDIYGWISQNIREVLAEFKLKGYRYTTQTTGHGLYLTITPTR